MAAGAFSSMRHRDFALFWTAASVSNTGSWMQAVAAPYVVFTLTHSTTWLGFASFASFFPGVVVGPAAGAIADRFPRRSVLLVTQGMQMGVAVVLWLLWVTGAATAWNLCATLFVAGVISSISITSWQSFVPMLVPREDLLNAVRLNSVQFTAARAIGPTVAGFVLARFGAGGAFAANAVSFVPVLAALAVVRPRHHTPAAERESVFRQFAAGVRYVRARTSMALAIMTILTVSLLPSALVQLAPAFATRQFGAGKAGYGALVGAYGAGALAAALLLAAHADRARRSSVALGGLAGSVAAMALLAGTRLYAVGLVAMVALGLAYVSVTVSLNTTIQLHVEEAFRGRVLSLYLMALMAGVPLGSLALGALSDAIGLRATAVVTAGCLAAYALAVGARLRAIDAPQP